MAEAEVSLSALANQLRRTLRRARRRTGQRRITAARAGIRLAATIRAQAGGLSRTTGIWPLRRRRPEWQYLAAIETALAELQRRGKLERNGQADVPT